MALSNNKYRCATTHDTHKRGEIITAEQHKTIGNPQYWVPVATDEQLRTMKANREKLVNNQNVIQK